MEKNYVKDDLKKKYDKEAEIYDKDYSTLAGNYFMWRKIKTALFLGSFKKGSRILEVGCANGPYTFELGKLGFEMTGLDLSPECIKYANEKAKKIGINNIEFIEGDAENLAMFSDNAFDGVVSFSCLRYVPNPQKAVNEIFRVVKKHNAVVLDFPNKRSPWFNYLKPWLMGGGHIHDHHYSTREANSFLQKAGFREIRVKRILFTPKSINPGLLRVMKGIDIIGEAPILNQFAAIIMCTGKKP